MQFHRAQLPTAPTDMTTGEASYGMLRASSLKATAAAVAATMQHATALVQTATAQQALTTDEIPRGVVFESERPVSALEWSALGFTDVREADGRVYEATTSGKRLRVSLAQNMDSETGWHALVDCFSLAAQTQQWMRLELPAAIASEKNASDALRATLHALVQRGV